MTEKNSKNANFQLLALAVAVGFIAAVAGITMWYIVQAQRQPSTAALVVLPEPKVIADFALVDHRGASFSLENLRGQWSLIFFGFTHCPDVCPNTLYDLKLINESLNRVSDEEDPGHQVVFVSVDPERDTPEMLSQYVSYFDPDFIGVTGEPEQLVPLAMQLGIAYRLEEHEPGSAKYDVYHSTTILLTDPKGRLHGVFSAPHDAEKLARELVATID